VTKFVPASGAATRMFKEAIAALNGTGRPSESSAVREFFAHLDAFPFSEELRARSGVAGTPSTEAEERTVLRVMLEDMRFAELPKGLIPFHRASRLQSGPVPRLPSGQAGSARTAFEEQLLEGTGYTCAADRTCRMHFTVAPGLEGAFLAALEAARPLVETERPQSTLAVAFSEQQPSTDTVAIGADGELFRSASGGLLFRPSGHGALLRNLDDLHGDIVVLKNIDNVLPFEASEEVVRWKRLLIGCVADLQRHVSAHMEALSRGASGETLDAAVEFAAQRFARRPDEGCRTVEERRQFAMAALDRPIRVCGVVRNEGEPGGAPIWVRSDGQSTVQIVELSQVDTRDLRQAAIARAATHFNPVDIVCATRSWRGEPFDLSRFVDEDTALVVKKSADGRELTALERPGLWNGSMAGWNTVCVEVPGSTFAPVKTVLDLLRPEHQPRRTQSHA
jgi:hypothetical protein